METHSTDIRIPIKGFEGIYEIDLSGNVYSVLRQRYNSLGRLYTYKPKRIKPIAHETGYQVVNLCLDGEIRTIRLHRIIAEHLIPNPHNKPFVNHKDGNKANNVISNLEWVTELENTEHAIKSGLFKVNGFDNPYSKFTQEDALIMQRLELYGLSKVEIGKVFSCNRNTVRKCINRLIPGENYKGE
jgi:hypothetical protein